MRPPYGVAITWPQEEEVGHVPEVESMQYVSADTWHGGEKSEQNVFAQSCFFRFFACSIGSCSDTIQLPTVPDIATSTCMRYLVHHLGKRKKYAVEYRTAPQRDGTNYFCCTHVLFPSLRSFLPCDCYVFSS